MRWNTTGTYTGGGHFDFNRIDFKVPGALHMKIEGYQHDWEKEFGITTGIYTNLDSRFNRILQAAAEQTGHGAVVLVDEYDKPLQDVLEKSRNCWNRTGSF